MSDKQARDNDSMPRLATVTVDIVSFPESGLPPAFRVGVTTQTGTVYWVPEMGPLADPDLAKNRLAVAAYELAHTAWSQIG